MFAKIIYECRCNLAEEGPSDIDKMSPEQQQAETDRIRRLAYNKIRQHINNNPRFGQFGARRYAGALGPGSRANVDNPNSHDVYDPDQVGAVMEPAEPSGDFDPAVHNRAVALASKIPPTIPADARKQRKPLPRAAASVPDEAPRAIAAAGAAGRRPGTGRVDVRFNPGVPRASSGQRVIRDADPGETPEGVRKLNVSFAPGVPYAREWVELLGRLQEALNRPIAIGKMGKMAALKPMKIQKPVKPMKPTVAQKNRLMKKGSAAAAPMQGKKLRPRAAR